MLFIYSNALETIPFDIVASWYATLRYSKYFIVSDLALLSAVPKPFFVCSPLFPYSYLLLIYQSNFLFIIFVCSIYSSLEEKEDDDDA